MIKIAQKFFFYANLSEGIMFLQEGERVRYSVSLVNQGSYRFYTLTMPSDILGKSCFVSSRAEDPMEGFQRLLDEKRAQDIADYIDSGLGTIPSSIILSAQPEANFKLVDRSKTVEFTVSPKSFLIIDGQHRVYGFTKAKSELRVPVVIYNGLTKAQETRLFIDINTKQKQVPNELLLDIKQLADVETDVEALLRRIFNLFNEAQDSPLLGMMSASDKVKGKISRVTFNNGVKPLLDAFNSLGVLEIYSALRAYITSTISAISSSNKSIDIAEATSFRGIMAIFPEVAQRVKDRFGREYTTENFYSVILPMYERVNTAKLDKTKNSPKAFKQILEDALKERFSL